MYAKNAFKMFAINVKKFKCKKHYQIHNSQKKGKRKGLSSRKL